MSLSIHRTNIGFTLILVVLLSFAVILLTEIVLITNRNDAAITINTSRLTKQEESRSTTQSSTTAANIEIEWKTVVQYGSSVFNNYNVTPVDAVWQNVAGTRDKFYVYSAYLDSRKREQIVVRIIGATTTKHPAQVWCKLKYVGGNMDHVLARVQVIRENWNLKYSAVFILCPVDVIYQTGKPHSVSVAVDLESPLTNCLIVRNTEFWGPKIHAQAENKIAICVKPLHFSYNKFSQLIEFMEMNKLLGVSHFTFYNDTVSPNVNCILRDYMKEGTVTVLPWKLNMLSQIEIRTEGMFAALNDCLYRNMYTFEYLMFLDFDEIIVPKFMHTLQDLMRWISYNVNNSQSVSAYSFRNAFFYLQWDDDISVRKFPTTFETNLTLIRKTRRMIKLHPHRHRSKYICKPVSTVEVGNHFVWQFMPQHGTLNVPPNMAILHHYRVCEFGGDDCVNANSTIDRTVHKYWTPLVQKVVKRWMSLIPTCNLPPM